MVLESKGESLVCPGNEGEGVSWEEKEARCGWKGRWGADYTGAERGGSRTWWYPVNTCEMIKGMLDDPRCGVGFYCWYLKKELFSGSGLPQLLQLLIRLGLVRRTLENDSEHHKKGNPRHLQNCGWRQIFKLFGAVSHADSSSSMDSLHL